MPVSYAKSLAYRGNAHAVGRRWRDYLQLAAAAVSLLVLAAVTPSWWNKEFVLGFLLGAIVIVAVLSAMRLHDPQVRGYSAEIFSVDALKRVRGWSVIDNLPFDKVDIDHVVITPSTVLAVESKHHGSLPLRHPSAHKRARNDLACAQASARKLRSLLRSKKLHDAATVTPVLMIWGPGAPDLAEGYRLVDGVYVVDADHPELWRHLFSAPLIDVTNRHQLATALREFSRARDEHDSAKNRPLWRELITEFREGVNETKQTRKARRELHASRRRRHGRSADSSLLIAADVRALAAVQVRE